jgi:hypothetical protein
LRVAELDLILKEMECRLGIEPPSFAPNKPEILVVDDDGDLRNSLCDVLNTHLLRLPRTGSESCWPFSQRDVQCELRRVCKAAGLEVRNPHDLRHTYATTLLMAGMSPAYVQRQLGHSSIAITVDIYGHWIPGEGRAGLEAALAGGAGKGSGEGKIVPFSVP